MLEMLFTVIVEFVIYIAVCTVSYYTGKILILTFTLGKYSSESYFDTSDNNSFFITNVETNKKQISSLYTSNIGFLAWIVFICIIVIKYLVLSD